MNKELLKEYNARIEEMVEKEGRSEEDAQNKTYKEYVPKMRKSCRRVLTDYLILWQKVQDTDLYRKLMQTAENLMLEDDYNLEESIRQAVKQRKFTVDQLIVEKEINDETDDESEDESE